MTGLSFKVARNTAAAVIATAVLGCSGSADNPGAGAQGSIQGLDDALVLGIENNRQAELAVHLLDRIPVHHGLVLEVYEPSPGEIVWSALGTTETQEQNERLVRELTQMQPSEVHRRFVPDQPLPRVLIDAEARGQVAALENSRRDVGVAQPSLVEAPSTLVTSPGIQLQGGTSSSGVSSTANTSSNCSAGAWDFEWCLKNQSGDQSSPGYCTNVEEFDGHVCVTSGIINRFGKGPVVNYVTNVAGNWLVSLGECRWVYKIYINHGFYARTQVLDAVTDVYDNVGRCAFN